MSTVQEIEEAVARLPREQFAEFKKWFEAQTREEELDKQIERDVAAGKFDAGAQKGLSEHKAGKLRPL